MRSLRLFSPLLLLLAPACASKAQPQAAAPAMPYSAELAEHQAIYDNVKVAIEAKDFAALNNMEREFRTNRSRTSSGIWKLATFYGSVVPYWESMNTDGKCDFTAGPFLNAWRDADPKEPGAYIAEASLLISNGWCYRGSGFADSVSEEGSIAFHRKIAAALDILERHAKIASVDPEFYRTMERIYTAQGRDKIAFQRLLKEGTDREPYYYSLYFSAQQYYLPQWYGSSREIDELARFSVERTKEKDGAGAYARFYWYYTQCGCDIDKSVLDLPLLKSAMHDVISRYPGDWNASNFAKINCEIGEKLEASKYIKMLIKADGQAWENKDQWATCEREATAEVSFERMRAEARNDALQKRGLIPSSKN
jgi:hypothetical protein